ncbi:PREDICTED: LOB domain-containing protein 19 [Tarenaya hassleriana]|uniref:LOB domain-containing protein 19 n=1 Tax=Tarenaya hassleriana TaxID=28532 RepID=UPI00053C5FC4|nr:PREDICTED: LOB domain-containing protein 19 [Tarenaya hassleriana]
MNGNMKGSGGGPCGACKFLRRKCVGGCIFAPYFDGEEGTSRFAAVHKVFGASNASKMLMKLPSNKRLDASVTLCYEALSRLRDPVYGPVSLLFSLQHQVVKLQAELAYIQARLSTFQRFPPQQLHPSLQIPPSLRWSSPSDMTQPSLPQVVVPNSHSPTDPSDFDLWEEDPLAIDDRALLQQQVATQLTAMNFPAAKLPASTSG